jgi:hypothetical protein
MLGNEARSLDDGLWTGVATVPVADEEITREVVPAHHGRAREETIR